MPHGSICNTGSFWMFMSFILGTQKIPLSVMVSKYEQEALGLSANFSYLVSKL